MSLLTIGVVFFGQEDEEDEGSASDEEEQQYYRTGTSVVVAKNIVDSPIKTQEELKVAAKETLKAQKEMHYSTFANSPPKPPTSHAEDLERTRRRIGTCLWVVFGWGGVVCNWCNWLCVTGCVYVCCVLLVVCNWLCVTACFTVCFTVCVTACVTACVAACVTGFVLLVVLLVVC